MNDRTRSRDRDDEPRRGRERDERPSSRSRDDEPRSRSSARDDDRGGRGDRDRDEPRGRSSSRDDDRGGRSSRSSSSYTYERRDADDARKRSTQGANDFDKVLKDGVKMWKPQDGDNRIRILPPTWPKPKHFAYDIWVHYGVGPDRQSYLDLQKMTGEPDPISEELDRVKREESPDEQYVKDLTSKKRALVYLIDRNAPKEGVQAWAMPWTVDRDIIKVSIDKENGEVLPIDDPIDGYDVEFEKKGQGARTEYLAVSIARRSSPLGDDRWLDYAVDNPLPDQLNYFDYDYIAKVFGAQGQQRDRGGRDDRGRDDERDRDRGGARGGRDERDDRGRDRDDDRGRRQEPRSASRRSEPDEPTWASVHDMTATELEDLIEQEKLDIDPRAAKGDADLADWICEEMKLEQAPARSSRREPEPEPASTGRRRVVDDDADGKDAAADKLREMRERRRG